MKFYERLSTLERRKLVLEAVALDCYFEGMGGALEECLKELRELEQTETGAETFVTEKRKAD